jgi:hypothetical protein
MEDGGGAVTQLLMAILPYVGYTVFLVAIGFFLLMIRAITTGAKQRSVRHRKIQDHHLRR